MLQGILEREITGFFEENEGEAEKVGREGRQPPVRGRE